MTPLRGWNRRGERLVAKAPHGHWKTLTFIGALRHDRIEAPCVFDGPINGQSFTAYVEQILVPTLRPGDVVVPDNLGSHKGQAVRQAIRAAGAKIYFLPPYSPDLNPYRTGLRQAQTRHVQSRRAKPRRHMEARRSYSARLQKRRVRPISHRRWIRFNMKRSCSNRTKRNWFSPFLYRTRNAFERIYCRQRFSANSDGRRSKRRPFPPKRRPFPRRGPYCGDGMLPVVRLDLRITNTKCHS